MSFLPPVYTFRRGGKIAYGVFASGDLTGASMVAKLKPVAENSFEVPGDDVPVAAILTVTFVPASGDSLAYWLFSLSGAQSKELPAGRYITDATLSIGGVPEDVTQPAVIELENSVSG